MCLGVTELTPGHTGDHIVKDLSEVLHSWNLEARKICFVTTDGGANIVAAVRKFMASKCSHVPCVAHLLNLCVCRALSLSGKATAATEQFWCVVNTEIFFMVIT